MPQSPDLVLFDLDGTLVDSYDAIHASVNHVRSLRGLEPWTHAQVRGAVGNGLPHLLEQAVPVGTPDENEAEFKKHHLTVLVEGTRLLPGVGDTLLALQAAGRDLGVCSNKPVAITERLLAGMELAGRPLADLFDCVLGPESVPRRKPAPDMLREAMTRTGHDASDTLYVGDMSIDVATARAAGVPVWVIATGSHSAATLRAAQPDRLMDTFDELHPKGRGDAS